MRQHASTPSGPQTGDSRCPSQPDMSVPYVTSMLNWQAGRSPLGKSLQQSSGLSLTAAKEFYRAIRVHAVRPTAIGDVFLVFRQLSKPPLKLVHRDRNRARDMSGLVFAHRPCVENNHRARPSSLEELLQTHRFRGRSVAELLMHETLEISEPALGDTLDGRAQLEHRRIREAVIDEESLFAAFDQCGLLERLKVLRGVGDRQSGLRSQRINRALGLGQEFQEFQPVWIAERFADSGELAVQAIFEVTVRGHFGQVINRLLDQKMSIGLTSGIDVGQMSRFAS
jgi:hypothetical protein